MGTNKRIDPSPHICDIAGVSRVNLLRPDNHSVIFVLADVVRRRQNLEIVGNVSDTQCVQRRDRWRDILSGGRRRIVEGAVVRAAHNSR